MYAKEYSCCVKLQWDMEIKDKQKPFYVNTFSPSWNNIIFKILIFRYLRPLYRTGVSLLSGKRFLYI